MEREIVTKATRHRTASVDVMDFGVAKIQNACLDDG
jgi:hypothetical protein